MKSYLALRHRIQQNAKGPDWRSLAIVASLPEPLGRIELRCPGKFSIIRILNSLVVNLINIMFNTFVWAMMPRPSSNPAASSMIMSSLFLPLIAYHSQNRLLWLQMAILDRRTACSVKCFHLLCRDVGRHCCDSEWRHPKSENVTLANSGGAIFSTLPVWKCLSRLALWSAQPCSNSRTDQCDARDAPLPIRS